ncbi:uncharacterized protein LOC143432101 [Xylocopa sonorina]|uniref:uncharacterized protein LOC143429379 n=1 Tax=Xylocopa sonorina TaxID=1818115 RepID=UPI00403AE737
MRCSAFCVLVLAISEPLLVYAGKAVLVIPQRTRRIADGPSWQSGPLRYRKSPSGSEVHYRKYYSPSTNYESKKSVHGNPHFPHGGDDFDLGYELVNHVKIPHGKGINHALTFGKGYVPYDKIKGTFALSSDRPSSSQEHSYVVSEYAPTAVTSSGSEYISSEHYEPSQSETLFPDQKSALNYNEWDDQKKLYSSRSIEKSLTTNSAVKFGDSKKDQLLNLQQKASELYKSIDSQPQDGVLLPSGIPSASIGGSKEGIILRDMVALDEYQQKLQEMTKSWPQFSNAVDTATFSNGFQNHQVTASYLTGASPTSSFGSSSWPVSFAQPKQGYDVKEDTMEPPHDFRTMPVQTSYHTFPVPVNVAFSGIGQMIRG